MDRLKQIAYKGHRYFNALTLAIDRPMEGRLGKQSEKDRQYRTYVDHTLALFTRKLSNDLEEETRDALYRVVSLFVSHKDTESALCI